MRPPVTAAPCCLQLLAALRDPRRDVALQAFELVQTLIEQHPAAREALLAAGAVKVHQRPTAGVPAGLCGAGHICCLCQGFSAASEHVNSPCCKVITQAPWCS